jgi:hypothetical protein
MAAARVRRVQLRISSAAIDGGLEIAAHTSPMMTSVRCRSVRCAVRSGSRSLTYWTTQVTAAEAAAVSAFTSQLSTLVPTSCW